MKILYSAILVLLVTSSFSQLPTQITTHSALDMRPVWTPDGNHLLFISNRNSTAESGWNGFTIWKIPSNGGTSEKIEVGKQSIHQVNISPNGNSIVFYNGQNEPYWDIYKVSAEGGEAINLTKNQAANMSPKFSADGSLIIFSRDIGEGHDIWTMLPDGTSLSQITTDEGSDRFPCYSPDGQKIAFASERSGNFDIWIKNLETEELTQLTNSPGNKYTPCWSPDGNYLAYINDISGTFDIFITSQSGGEPIQFTTDPADDMYPCWSPDGSKITFSSNRTGNDDVWVKEVDITSVNNYSVKDISDFVVFPNPFYSIVQIQYSVKFYSLVNLSITDSAGRLIKTLVNKNQNKGLYKISWDGSDRMGTAVLTGNYLCKLNVGKKQQVIKIIKTR